MKSNQIAQVLPGLKGAQVSILVVFLLSAEKVAYGRNDLAAMSGYNVATTAQALHSLALKGYVQRLGRYNSWVLTADARQLFLFEREVKNLHLEVQNLHLPTSIGSSTTLISEEETTSTKTDAAKVKNPLSPDAQAAVELLVQGGIVKSLPSGKGAEDSVRVALDAGWDGVKCCDCVTSWLDLADTPDGAWIDTPYALAAAKLRALRFASVRRQRRDRCDPRRYIEGEYGDVIKH